MAETIQLVHAINEFNGSDESFNRLMLQVCDISEKQNISENPILKHLIFEASEKMRTFGYIFMNDIHLEHIISQKGYSNYFRSNAINTLYTSETGILFDSKQFDIIKLFEENQRLFVSAPTSFGKTFIVKELLFKNRKKYNNILLIFPTVSLLNENILTFKKFIKDYNLDYTIVSNTHSNVDVEKRNIFILTPERVLKLLVDYPSLPIDFFFLDEVYKIDNLFNIKNNGEDLKESERDKVFRITLYLLSNKIHQFYLAGPYINLDKIGIGLKKFINSHSVSFIEIKNELIKKDYNIAWNTKFSFDDTIIPYQSHGKMDRMVELCEFISSNEFGQTIIYAESKSKVTELSRYLYENIRLNRIINEEVQDFINHLQRRYTVKYNGVSTRNYWTLLQSLKIGIGIHHGAYPKYIQNELLSLFNKGYINFLFTTTSITEGVNTKAKNVIIYGKRKGTKELKKFDIKNICGRAGRYYHNFIGRVFFLEKEVYDILNSEDEVLDFITYGETELSAVDIDNTELEHLTKNNADIKIERQKIIDSYDINDSVFIKNRLVDKLKQIELINLLKVKGKEYLTNLVGECSSIREFLSNSTLYTILGYFEKLELLDEFEFRKYGKIASDYSKRNGLFLLINYHLENTIDAFDNKNIDKVYINVFSDIRNIIEFKVPRFISIFANILEYVCSLEEFQVDTKSMDIDKIINFFELGVFTNIGVYLAEAGFPIPTIKELERSMPRIMESDIEFARKNHKRLERIITRYLDSYEYKLFVRIFNET